MKRVIEKTKKGAAAIYVVIFTTTLLGVITLSFIRIMMAESLRTTNYSLSQSAYNSALAGVEDAKIVLLRYQNCVNFGSYYASGGTSNADCGKLTNAFGTESGASATAKKCNAVGYLLGRRDVDLDTSTETVIKTGTSNNETIDQAYTCVKISSFTDDFLAVLNEAAPTKIVPLRTENQTKQNEINRIQVSWYNSNNDKAAKNDGGATIARLSNNGNIPRINPSFSSLMNPANVPNNGASFGEMTLAPPPLQVSFIQTADTFTTDDFYSTTGNRSNRVTLMLRPSQYNGGGNDDIKKAHGGVSDSNHSNALGNATYSAKKVFNTPADIYCNVAWTNGGGYACTADFSVTKPIGGDNRNLTTSYVLLNLPYGGPETDVAVKMYHCDGDDTMTPLTAENFNNGKCSLVKFANVQPMVDSTGRANDLFRRVESRIELADTSFPITSFALAVDGDSTGVRKNFYVTKNCYWSSSKWNGSSVSETTGNCGGNAGGDNGSN